jgi:hypothetical protein
MLGRLSRIGRSPLHQIQATAVLIMQQLRRSATTGAAIRSIDHNDVIVV